MPEATTAPVRRRRRWPWIVAALVLVAFLLRGPLLAPVVTRVVADQLATAIDGQAQVESAGGGWFGDARLSGITAEAALGTLRHLRIRDIQATYGLGIIGGDLSALRSLKLDGVEATIDLRSPGDGWNGVVPPLLELLPSPLPQATFTGEIRLLLPEYEVRLSDIRLMVVGDEVALAVRVQVADAEPLQVVAAFRRPAIDTLRLEQAVVLGDATIETLELVLGRARQHLIGAVQLGGGRLMVHADPANARVVAEGLELSAIPPSLSALLPSNLGALRGVVAGEASALQSPSGWNVAGSLRMQDVVVAGAGPFTLSGQWHLGAGVVQVPRISVTGPAKGQVTIDSLVWSLADYRPRSGTIRATVPDLRGWLPVTVAMPDIVVAVNAEMEVEGDALAIRTARLAGGGVELTVQGSVARSPWRIEAADVAVRADLATVSGLVPGAPNLAGVLRLRATGAVPFTSDPAVFMRTPCELQVRGDGVMVSALAVGGVRLDAHTADGQLHLTQGEATVAGIGVAVTGTVALTGAHQDASWRGALASLALNFPGVVANASEPCPFTFTSDGWNVGPLRLVSDAGALSVETSHRAGAGILVIDAPHVDLGRLGLSELSGTAKIGIDLRGDWSAPAATVSLISDDLRVGTRRARANVQLTQDAHGIAIRVGQIDAGDDGVVSATGTVPLLLGRAGLTLVPDDGKPARVDLQVPELSRWLPRIASGNAQIHLQLGDFQEAQPLSGRLTFTGVRPRPFAEDPVGVRQAALSVLDGSVTLHGSAEGLEAEMAMRADEQQVFTGALRSPGALSAQTLAGAWRSRALAGKIQLAGLQLARLAAALPGVQHLSGIASGGLELSGTVAEPQWRGSLALSAVEVKVATDVPTLAEGNAQLELDGRIIHLRQGAFTLGGAPVTMVGDLTLGDPPHLALRLDGRNALLVQRHDARLRADLALNLNGPLDQVSVAGRAVVTSALFSPDISLWQGGGRGGDGRLVPFEFVTPPLSTVRFDVQVSSAFTSAQDGVRVATSLVRADCDLDLHLRGSGAAPELSGRVVVRQGHVFLPFSTLRLSNGEVRFPDGDPFHPRLNAVATAQVRRWRVTLQVDGPLADPQVRASGDGLDERDALLLLTTGSTSAELSGEEGQRAAIGRLGTWLGREAWDFIDGETDPDAAPGLVDRLTLEFGRQVSEGGKDTIEAQVELTEPEINPGVVLFGERDRWEDYNAGLILRFRWGGEE